MLWHSFMRSKENEKLQGFAWKEQIENNESDGHCSGSCNCNDDGKGKHRPNEQSNKIPWQSQIAQCSFCTYSVFFLVITLFCAVILVWAFQTFSLWLDASAMCDQNCAWYSPLSAATFSSRRTIHQVRESKSFFLHGANKNISENVISCCQTYVYIYICVCGCMSVL